MRTELTIQQAGRTVLADENETVLAAALRNGIPYPFSCQAGRCGACKSRLLEGQVEHLTHSRFTLTESEKAAGIFLACRAKPSAKTAVAWLKEPEETLPSVTVAAEVAAVESLTHDIVRLRIETAGAALAFKAGQFAILKAGSCEPRSYSMSNRPGEDTLEFFIRKVPGGQASSYIHDRLRVGDRVEVEGPFGDSYLRTSHTGPVLLVAGGSGLAPIRSILLTALEAGFKQSIHLYFGVREERDVFLAPELEALRRRHANFHYRIAVEKGVAGSAYRSNLRVGEALLADWPRFEGIWQAYLAGPPVLIESLVPELNERGIPDSNIFSDPFYFVK